MENEAQSTMTVDNTLAPIGIRRETNEPSSKEIRNLGDLVGKEIQVSAYFVRYGRIGASNEETNNITILLKEPYTYEGGAFRRISTHCWVVYNDSLKKCHLKHGDKVTFFATVSVYHKRAGTDDYTLTNINNARVLQRNPTPIKLGVFEFSVPFLTRMRGYIALKGRSSELTQKRLIINGQYIPSSDEDPPLISFKLKDISRSGVFRFYYKLPGQDEWCKYAYFFPMRGQKIFLITNNEVARIFLDESSYFALKDAHAQFAFSGEYHFPMRSREIRKLAQKDADPNLIDGRWPSKRLMLQNC